MLKHGYTITHYSDIDELLGHLRITNPMGDFSYVILKTISFISSSVDLFLTMKCCVRMTVQWTLFLYTSNSHMLWSSLLYEVMVIRANSQTLFVISLTLVYNKSYIVFSNILWMKLYNVITKLCNMCSGFDSVQNNTRYCDESRECFLLVELALRHSFAIVYN